MNKTNSLKLSDLRIDPEKFALNNGVKAYLLGASRRSWLARFILFPFIRPKRFLIEFVYTFIDFLRFRKSAIEKIKAFSSTTEEGADNGLLLVAGWKMNVMFIQLWVVLTQMHKRHGYKIYALTSRNQPVLNLYFRLGGAELIFIEDIGISVSDRYYDFIEKESLLNSYDDIKNYQIDGVPYGEMAMSTYGRLNGTGLIETDTEAVRNSLRKWISYLRDAYQKAAALYREKSINMLFFTEVFMEEYGAFYYAALKTNLNVVRFAVTARDDAVIVQHLTSKNDRTHHATVSEDVWQKIKRYPVSMRVKQELKQNFIDRYSDKWELSRRNQPGTVIYSEEETRKLAGVRSGRKVAIIYSHILYDTLFFFGKDLFSCYAEWFVETVKAACRNDQVDWFVKIHPSNLWRGDLDYFFAGKYEEVRLIEEEVGDLPPHVKLIYPDTDISPYSWMSITDFGVTVRGTSGIELAALGKTVITAGTGRYEKMGITVNPNTAEEYLELMLRLPLVAPISLDQTELAIRYAYMTFCMKPYTLDFFKPDRTYGRKEIKSLDDLVWTMKDDVTLLERNGAMERFYEWSLRKEITDFLNEWPNVSER